MTQRFEDIINRFSGLKILVIGEGMLDIYLDGFSNRLCKEAPVPIVDLNRKTEEAGGAANAALNAAELGAKVTFLSSVGDDEEGKSLKALLEANGIDLQCFFLSRERKTLSKKRIFANGQLIVRLDSGSINPVDRYTENFFVEILKNNYSKFDAVIISDYGYGILTAKIRTVIKGLQDESDQILVIDAKHLSLYKDFAATMVKPNFAETCKLLDKNVKGSLKRADEIVRCKDQIISLTSSKITAVTLDKEGAVVLENRGSIYRTYAKAVEDSKAVGAGDTYAVAFLCSLAAKSSVSEAAEIASAAANVIVSKDSTATCTKYELKQYFKRNAKLIRSIETLKKILVNYRKSRKKIVFTNGCFDILHSGHVSFLNRAKSLGDILIVGLNSDSSVRRLKGDKRPINKISDRAMVMSGLSSVDNIVIFNEDLPINLIKIIKPHVFVKGGDYRLIDLPEAPVIKSFGGRVEILPYTANHSTTGIIRKIQWAI